MTAGKPPSASDDGESYRAAWEDLAARLKRADDELTRKAESAARDLGGDDQEHVRLVHKRAGVRLARDYMRGYGLPLTTTDEETTR